MSASWTAETTAAVARLVSDGNNVPQIGGGPARPNGDDDLVLSFRDRGNIDDDDDHVVNVDNMAHEERVVDDDEQVLPVGHRFRIVGVPRDHILKKFKINSRQSEISLITPPAGINPISWIRNAIRDIHAHFVKTRSPNDRIGVTFEAAGMTNGSAGISMRPVWRFDYEQLWDLLCSVHQSARILSVYDTLVFTVTYVDMVNGSGGLDCKIISNRSIVLIGNSDNLCFPRALVVALANTGNKQDRSEDSKLFYDKIRHKNSKLQRDEATKLVNEAGVVVPAPGCSNVEIGVFQRHFMAKGIAIVVYDWASLGSGAQPIFNGHERFQDVPAHTTLNIAHFADKDHYSPITNLLAAAGSRNYCVPCNVSHRFLQQHHCTSKCPRCYSSPPCPVRFIDENSGEVIRNDNELSCTDCNRFFHSVACFNNHLKPREYRIKTETAERKSVCQTVRFCKTCFKLFDATQKPHRCGKTFCQLCRSVHGHNEFCYMQPVAQRVVSDETKQPRTLFIFYDFETRQDALYSKTPGDNTREHVVTLCIAQQLCERCLSDVDDVSSGNACSWCGVRKHIFRRSPVAELIELSVRRTSSFSKIVCIAHNAKAFDAQFILRYVVEHCKDLGVPKLILTGNSIISMRIGRTVFIDSLNYFHMRLSALPEAFGFKDKMGKGYFPHLFNTLENQRYRGELPAAEFYSPETMSPSDHSAFNAWYEEATAANEIFDFQVEIEKYCAMDVDILRRACKEFRRIFLEVGNVCPFTEAATIASACSKVFRRNYLVPQTIGLIPSGGYRLADNHSKQANEWLLWVEHCVGYEIMHATRGREFRLPEGMLVDGYAERGVERFVYQYHGCYWHGCPRCFPENRAVRSRVNDQTYEQRYERTLAADALIREQGYTLQTVWECEFADERNANPAIGAFLRDHPRLKYDCLNPRDAFFGGRTGNTVTVYDVADGEKINYIDICSLYPYISKTGRFPVGHPKIYVGLECDSLLNGSYDALGTTVNGLIRCTVLPPRDLFHPLLPVRMHQKLLFALCRTCAENKVQTSCPHENTSERAFTGTWVADEVRKAIDIGYRVVKVFVIWAYEMTQYDPETREGGLFVGYINTFLKIKQQASGWPVECIDEASQTKYIDDYEQAEGIRLTPEKICKNSGLRSVAKLCLNSFWGKFGQRDNLTQTAVISNREQLLSLLGDNDKEVQRLLPVNDDVLYANWVSVDEAITSSAQTSVVIAAYTTAQARLKLYSYLERLDRRVLYYDTDSVIYVSTGQQGEWVPPLGNFLGDMTSELKKPTDYIKSFVSGGPKFYGYQVVNSSNPEIITKTECKVKGLSLNYSNSKKVNYASIRDMIKSDLPRQNAESIQLNYSSIQRTALHEVVTREMSKTCRVVCHKRRHVTHTLSLPFGYKDEPSVHD